VLERHFKPIEPLKQIVENTIGDESIKKPIKNETFFSDEKKEYMDPKPKRKRSYASFKNSFTSTKSMKSVPYNSNETLKILKSCESYEPFVEDVYKIIDENHSRSLSGRLFKRDKVVRRCIVNWGWDENTSAFFLVMTEDTRSIMFTCISATTVCNK